MREGQGIHISTIRRGRGIRGEEREVERKKKKRKNLGERKVP